MGKNHSLGKGLASLIPDNTSDETHHAYLPQLEIERIIPNQYQPRMEIDPAKLIELADSIREHGIIEPLIVKQNNEREYELIAGERRWRAAKLAGFTHVPVVLKDASPQQMLEMAIVENIQREDLNPLEEAMAFDHLSQKFKLTHEDIAKKMGYSRSAIANKIRLLNLPDEVKKALLQNQLSEGHARALLGLENTAAVLAAFRVVTRDHLSVRATEQLVQKLKEGNTSQIRSKPNNYLDPKLLSYEKTLRTRLNARIKINFNNNQGKMIIPFNSIEDFEKIMHKLKISL